MSTFPKSTTMPKVTVPSKLGEDLTRNKVTSAGKPSNSVRMSAQKPKYN